MFCLVDHLFFEGFWNILDGGLGWIGPPHAPATLKKDDAGNLPHTLEL